MPDRRRSLTYSEDGDQEQHASMEAAGSSTDDNIGRHGYESYRTSLAQVRQTSHGMIAFPQLCDVYIHHSSACLFATASQRSVLHTECISYQKVS